MSTESTVCLRRPAPSHSGADREATSHFEIEVPPHLARELGIAAITPLRSRIIQCDRPLAIFNH